MNNNGRPLGMRKTVQFLVILTLLAWATQTLFHQWGYGAVIPPPLAPTSLAATRPVGESTTRMLEVRPQATINGAAVMLRDICRWSDQDQVALEPYADVVVRQLGDGSVSVDEIRSALRDAGANLTNVQFSGAAQCAVNGAAMATVAAKGQANSAAATQTAAPKEIFEEQLVVTRPLSSGQKFIKSDFATRRVQVSQATTQPALAIDKLIGQVAARDLKAGETLTAGDVKAPQAVAAGEMMTVSLKIGPGNTADTVAKALNPGAAGDMIEAKNEATGEIYTVRLTGPNAGKVTTPQDSNDQGDSTTANGAN